MGFGIIGYALTAALTLLLVSPFLDQIWQLLVLPTEQWFPSTSVRTAPVNLVAGFMVGSWIALVARSRKVRRGGRLPAARRGLWVRAVLVAVISFAYLGSQVAVSRGRQLVDARWLEAVNDLLPGMSRGDALQRMSQTRSFAEPNSDEPERVTFDRRYDKGFGSEWSERFELDLEFDAEARLTHAFYVRRMDEYDLGLHACDVLVEWPAQAEGSRCAES